MLVFFIGVKVYGATRWLSIAPLGMRLQPSEFCKLALVMVLSAMFASPKIKVNRLPCLLLGAGTVALPFVLIVREPDLGSALILLPIYLAILFTAGLIWRYILLAGVAISILGGAVELNEAMQFRPMLKEYQRDRIRVFLNPELDSTDTGYNSYQARLAGGSGGLTGKGIGEGTQNTLGFLPQTVSNNDFIFSVIAEEVGFLGCLLLPQKQFRDLRPSVYCNQAIVFILLIAAGTPGYTVSDSVAMEILHSYAGRTDWQITFSYLFCIESGIVLALSGFVMRHPADRMEF